jgi:hypothetical protein
MDSGGGRGGDAIGRLRGDCRQGRARRLGSRSGESKRLLLLLLLLRRRRLLLLPRAAG